MLRRLVSVAVFAAVTGVTSAGADTIAQIGGPREMPPAGFKGQMFVDSRGCVFLRAGLNGVTNWVPRVNRDRQVLCGYPPTMASLGKPVEVAPAAGAPMPTVASVATAPVAPVAKVAKIDPILAAAQPAPVTLSPRPVVPVVAPAAVVHAQPPVAALTVAPPVAARLAAGSATRVQCHPESPFAQLVALSNGGAAIICTTNPQTLDGARAPLLTRVAAGHEPPVGAGLFEPGARIARAANAGAGQIGAAGTVARVASPETGGIVVANVPAVPDVVIPKGWKLAWKDQRLNPYRGIGTATGQAMQDQLWSRDVPARLVAETAGAAQPMVIVSSMNNAQAPVAKVHVSSKNEAPRTTAAPAKAASGAIFIQVGVFGVPSNAENAKARLRAAGLPVASAKGKAVKLVLSGPFADATSAQAALARTRAAGFTDAYIR